MSKRVLSVGQCVPDQAMLSGYLRREFGAQVDEASQLSDALEQLRQRPYDLVLVNRKLDIDYSDGLEVIQAIKNDNQLRRLPVMLITNYPEHQDMAIAAGAERGFGKLEYQKPETRSRLSRFLA